MYMQLWDAFLQSPHGCAALLAGGIVAHIAWDVIPYKTVYDGPLEDVYDNGIYFLTGLTGYHDDILLEEEILLIYGIDTGRMTFFNFNGPSH